MTIPQLKARLEEAQMPDDLELQFRMLINKFQEFRVGEDEPIGKGLISISPEHILKLRKEKEVLCKWEKRYIMHLLIDRGIKPHEIVEFYLVSLATLKKL